MKVIRDRICDAVHKCLQWKDGEIAGIDMLKLEQRIDGILEQLNKPVVSGKRHDLEWFLSHVGERVFRNKVKCDCESCKRGGEEGVLITDKTHANYLFDVQNELGIRYYAACASGAVDKTVCDGICHCFVSGGVDADGDCIDCGGWVKQSGTP